MGTPVEVVAGHIPVGEEGRILGLAAAYLAVVERSRVQRGQVGALRAEAAVLREIVVAEEG